MRSNIIEKWEIDGKIDSQKNMQLDKYQEYLKEENEKMNLTSIVEPDEVYEKHFLDSVQILDYYDFKNKSVLDIGSGAGFPGIVLKIFEPSIKLTIIEAIGKRVTFLEKLVEELGLKNVTVIHARAEDEADKFEECFDIAISRAVSHLSIMLELSARFVKNGGDIIALKGPKAMQEIEESDKAFKVLGLELDQVIDEELPYEKSSRKLIIINKSKKTPKIYPRNYGMIKKSQL